MKETTWLPHFLCERPLLTDGLLQHSFFWAVRSRRLEDFCCFRKFPLRHKIRKFYHKLPLLYNNQIIEQSEYYSEAEKKHKSTTSAFTYELYALNVSVLTSLIMWQVKVTIRTICESQLSYIDILKKRDSNKNYGTNY